MKTGKAGPNILFPVRTMVGGIYFEAREIGVGVYYTKFWKGGIQLGRSVYYSSHKRLLHFINMFNKSHLN